MQARVARQKIEKFEEIKLKGEANGWKLISTSFIDSRTKLKFVCNEGHTFDILSRFIDKKKCRVCDENSYQAAANRFYQSIKDKGGSVTENSYVNSYTNIEITCSEGHKWNSNPSSIRDGYWCPICNPKAGNKYYAILEKHNAIALEPYIDNKTKIRVQCREGHVFMCAPHSISYNSIRCAICSNRCPKAAAESYYKAVAEREGTPVDKYVNSETKLNIKCKNNHIFMGRPDHIKSGRWCPICNESKGELLVAKILTELELPFEKQAQLGELARCSYDFLTYYNGKHVFIEFDGKQHFQQAPYHTLEEFQRTQERDIEKTKLVIEKYKLRMIRISYRALEQNWDLKTLLKEALDTFLSGPVPGNPLVFIDQELYKWLIPNIVIPPVGLTLNIIR